MMKRSAGILPFKVVDGKLFVFLAHPGGPFWEKKDSWSICKGEYIDERPIDAAIREFCEESGVLVCESELFFIRSVKQANNKLITIFGIEKDIDETKFVSNTFKLEFPSGSGIVKEYPEMDRACWFESGEAKKKIFKGQVSVVEKLEEMVMNRCSESS